MTGLASNDDAALAADHGETLLTVAALSIRHGLTHGTQLPTKPDVYPEPLRQHRASFVTLAQDGRLRGCVGSVTAHCALVIDVATFAHAAAFRDHRFGPFKPPSGQPLRSPSAF
jgi:AMMECR1 domain-containing protein